MAILTAQTVNNGWSTLSAANTAMDGTGTIGTNLGLLWTAGASGGFLSQVRFNVLGTTAGACVVRLFMNNGSTPSTAGNNTLIAELLIPATTVSQTALAPALLVPPQSCDGLWIPDNNDGQFNANHKLYWTVSEDYSIAATAIGANY